MDQQLIQAVVLGVIQGLTEFLPISSSGHLIVIPALLGWDDPFIESLAFSVMLHVATLAALLIYFARDWIRLIPAGLAAIRDRSFEEDPDRRLAWLLAATTIPAMIVGVALNDLIETVFREPRLVAMTLVAGAAILWLADRLGSRTRPIEGLTFGQALGIGAAQALALVPGVSRSGISISAGLFAGLEREAAARFAFLMATPITAGAGLWEARKILAGEAGVDLPLAPLLAGMLASLIAGLLAIAVLLRYLRSHGVGIFVAYRLALAAVVVVAWLGLWDR
ncbi:MAG TPA: undecaprenyl-diphosphatase UppP [Candidatus Limnocylindrales bacterium]|nr:undecaprenyl-diphosphatase UppP [Candidatus Limnocylindrales bacterium]